MARANFPPPHLPSKNELSLEGFLTAITEARLTVELAPRSCSSWSKNGHLPTSDEVIFYTDFARAGLRFPLCPPLVELCEQLKVHPLMLTSNALRYWSGFKCLCAKRGWPYSLSVFRCFFQLQRLEGTFLLKPRWPQHPGFPDSGTQWSWGSGRLVVGDTASGHWKRHWFCVQNSFVDWNVNEVNFTSDAPPNTATLSADEVKCLASIHEAFTSDDWAPWDASEVTEEDLVMAGIVPTVSIPVPCLDWATAGLAVGEVPDADRWRRIIEDLPSVKGRASDEGAAEVGEEPGTGGKALVMTSPPAGGRRRTRQSSAVCVGTAKKTGRGKKDIAVVVVSGDEGDMLEAMPEDGASVRGRPRRKRDVGEHSAALSPVAQGVGTEILALREEPTSEAVAERLLKKAKGLSAAVGERGESGDLPSLSGPFDTSRDAVEGLALRFMRDRHRDLVEFEKLVLVFHRVIDESEANQDEVARLRKEVEAVRKEVIEVMGDPTQLKSARRDIERLEAALQESCLEKETMALEKDTQRVAHASIIGAKNADILKARKEAMLAERRAESLGNKVLELEATIKALTAQLDLASYKEYVGSSERALKAYHTFLPDFSGEVFTGPDDPWLGVVGDLVKRVEELSPNFPSEEVPLFSAYMKMVGGKSTLSAADELAEQIKKSLMDQAQAGPSKGGGGAMAGEQSGDDAETSE